MTKLETRIVKVVKLNGPLHADVLVDRARKVEGAQRQEAQRALWNLLDMGHLRLGHALRIELPKVGRD